MVSAGLDSVRFRFIVSSSAAAAAVPTANEDLSEGDGGAIHQEETKRGRGCNTRWWARKITLDPRP